MKKFFLPVLGFVIFSFIIVQHWPVVISIKGSNSDCDYSIRMPLKDKKRLEYFFRSACFLNRWAYTIMGSKPISTFEYIKPWAQIKKVLKHRELKYILREVFWPPDIHEIYYLLNPEQLRIKQGWEVLNKYIKNSPNSNLALLTLNDPDNDTVGLIIVNKTNLIKTVNQHLADFQEVLEAQQIEPDDLSDKEKLNAFLKNINSEALIGTILGYGRDNCFIYDKHIRNDLKEFPLVPMWPEEDDDTWAEERIKKLKSFQSWDISDLFYPQFSCDPDSEETKQLRKTYLEDREKIVKYYEGKDVVEATLSLFNDRL